MMSVLMLAFVLSLDSFLVSVALGTLDLGRSGERKLAALFAFCDSLAVLIGCLMGGSLLGEIARPFGKVGDQALWFYAAVIVVAGWGSQKPELWQRTVKLAYILPFLLSLDNLAAGLYLGKPGQPALAFSIAASGLVSGLMSMLGLRLGSLLGRGLRIPRRGLATAGLLASAVATWLR